MNDNDSGEDYSKLLKRMADRHNHFSELDREDELLVTLEALRRLQAERNDLNKVELLVRFVLGEESRKDLAKRHGVSESEVSNVRSHWLPRLERHVRDVQNEDEMGRLKLTSTDLGAIESYVKKL